MPPLLTFYYLCHINPQKIMEMLRYFYHPDDASSGTMARYFYHPDHIGSSSWITDGTGQAIQHLHYLPFGEDWVDQRNSWNTPYTFSGKEKDAETGYGYFGARYYDSGLSIWLSVDPMSDKYPSMSPYNYCANNPVILVDPDGRDCDVKVNEENKTITISAVYYTSKDNKSILKNHIDAWNSQSGKYEITDENGVIYTVIFDLKIDKGNYSDDTSAKNAFEKAKKTSTNVNFFEINNIDPLLSDGTNRGVTRGGNEITVRSDSPSRTGIHEIGHTLGSMHFSIGVMEKGGTSSNIVKSNIFDIFYNSGQPVECRDQGIYEDFDCHAKITWKGRKFDSNSSLLEKK